MACTNLSDRARGSLLGAFIGDALGAPVKLLSAADIAAEFPRGVRELVSQLDLQSWHDQAAAHGMTVADLAASNPTCPVGHDTDDTLLLLSLTEAIVAAGGKPPDTATCAARVVEA